MQEQPNLKKIMNAYIFLTQKNTCINDIPPRLMWNVVDNSWGSASGYCGETSILSAGLLYGQYVPMYLIRQLLADYFNNLWGDNPSEPSAQLQTMWYNYFGVKWNDSGAPGGDYPNPGNVHLDWFQKNGQFYCQVLTQIWNNSAGADNSSFVPTNVVLKNLHLSFEHFMGMAQDTKNNFIPWMKKHVCNGNPVIIGVQDFLAGSNDPDFDHIVLVIGWGSNNDFSKNQYFADDEIIFIDHGLVVCGQQPHGGSISYYFRYVMETQNNVSKTGGWLPDGGCPDPSNPAWNFIMDLGKYRSLNSQLQPCNNGKYTCNTYQLAQSPSQMGSAGNAGFAINGLSDELPIGVKVRIDTDVYYQIPCITSQEAKSGIQPSSSQTINHTITVSGLDNSLSYNVWLFTAKTTDDIRAIPVTGFNNFGKTKQATCYAVNGVESTIYNCSLPIDTALIVRCVLSTDT